MFDWSGLYFGAQGGGIWSKTRAVYGPSNPAATISGDTGQGFSSSLDSWIVGGQVGYQYQFDRLVFGLEGTGTILLGPIRGTREICPKTSIVLFNCSANINEILTAGGRLGWSMGNWLPYMTGGYAVTNFTGEVTNLQLAPGGFHIIDWKGRADGWYLGGGIDFAIMHGVTLGVEYRHYDFRNRQAPAKATIGGIPDSNLPNDNATFKSNADTVTLRLSYKFSSVPR